MFLDTTCVKANIRFPVAIGCFCAAESSQEPDSIGGTAALTGWIRRNNISHANKRRDAALAEALFWMGFSGDVRFGVTLLSGS
jgi:hypothetical protein